MTYGNNMSIFPCSIGTFKDFFFKTSSWRWHIDVYQSTNKEEFGSENSIHT